MVSIGTLFDDFMNLINLNFYTKEESDEKYIVKQEFGLVIDDNGILRIVSEENASNIDVSDLYATKRYVDEVLSNNLKVHLTSSGELILLLSDANVNVTYAIDEGSVIFSCSVTDEEDEGIEGVCVSIMKEDTLLGRGLTDNNGECNITYTLIEENDFNIKATSSLGESEILLIEISTSNDDGGEVI